MSPSLSYVGDTYTVTVKIADGQPLFSTTTFLVSVVKQANSAPTFTSTPPAKVYAYNVVPA
jgi:hypothetical protein